MLDLPRVAITICIDRGQRLRTGRDYLYVSRAYASAVKAAGALPLLVGPDTDAAGLMQCCDGVIISGGDDLPHSFTDFSAPATATPEDAERIAWERGLLDLSAAQRKPLLGICYGMQLINLHFGGRLHVNLAASMPQALDHGGGGRHTRHALTRGADSALLSSIIGLDTVNSSHHQAVTELAPGFVATALAPDGTIEALERDALYGVTWHPETDPLGPELFANFVALLRR